MLTTLSYLLRLKLTTIFLNYSTQSSTQILKEKGKNSDLMLCIDLSYVGWGGVPVHMNNSKIRSEYLYGWKKNQFKKVYLSNFFTNMIFFSVFLFWNKHAFTIGTIYRDTEIDAHLGLQIVIKKCFVISFFNNVYVIIHSILQKMFTIKPDNKIKYQLQYSIPGKFNLL